MNFCSDCGSTGSQTIPPGDTLPRFVCDACGTIHYQNPKMVVGCIIEWEEQILLCQRAIEPRYGLWTIPAGFMENHETLEEATLRETWEEAKAQVDITSLFGVFSIPAVSQVYTIFQGKLRALEFGAGEESLDVQLVHIHQIPWDQLAFPVMTKALTLYCQDRNRQECSTHVETIGPHPVG